MITIQQKLFRLLKIFSPAMQDQKLASPVVASLQGEEQLVAAVLRPSHRVPAGSVSVLQKIHFGPEFCEQICILTFVCIFDNYSDERWAILSKPSVDKPQDQIDSFN